MTLSPERKKLVDRITKLMALAESTNHNAEADSARNMAAELMAKHNISVTQLNVTEEFVTEHQSTGRQAVVCKHEDILANCIANLNGVSLVRGSNVYIFIGKCSDIESFKYMHDIVLQQRNAAWGSYYKARWNKHPGASQLNKWKLGFAYGVSIKVRELMTACDNKQQEWGLVPVQPHTQALDWYQQEHKVKFAKSQSSQYNREGMNAGKNISLNKGVEARNTNNLRIA